MKTETLSSWALLLVSILCLWGSITDMQHRKHISVLEKSVLTLDSNIVITHQQLNESLKLQNEAATIYLRFRDHTNARLDSIAKVKPTVKIIHRDTTILWLILPSPEPSDPYNIDEPLKLE